MQGKDALSAYRRAGLQNLFTLGFVLDHAIWDPSQLELLVIYEANLNENRNRACELMTFNQGGFQIKGEALYGAPL